MFKVLDLFSGIGGFSLGLESTGCFKTLAFCEIEKYPQSILRRHWPGVPIYEDIREMDTRGLFPDIITGGYPCQPFSNAGKQQGEKDPRHLWPDMLRIIKETKPRWVICENVYGHIRLGLDTVLDDLESEGYTTWSFIIPACSVGAPHERKRVFIVAHSKTVGVQRLWSSWKQESERYGKEKETLCSSKNVANSSVKRSQRQRKHVKPLYSKESKTGKTIKSVNGSLGEIWSTEPNVGRVANGISSRVDRLKGLGNAIVPQIAKVLGETIIKYEGEINDVRR